MAEQVFTLDDCGKDVYHIVKGKGYIHSITPGPVESDRPVVIEIGVYFYDDAGGVMYIFDQYGRFRVGGPQELFKGPVTVIEVEQYKCWQDPPPHDLRVDDPVFVKPTGNSEWTPAHFAKWSRFKDRWVLEYFAGGCTSHSIQTNTHLVAFDYKLP